MFEARVLTCDMFTGALEADDARMATDAEADLLKAADPEREMMELLWEAGCDAAEALGELLPKKRRLPNDSIPKTPAHLKVARVPKVVEAAGDTEDEDENEEGEGEIDEERMWLRSE